MWPEVTILESIDIEHFHDFRKFYCMTLGKWEELQNVTWELTEVGKNPQNYVQDSWCTLHQKDQGSNYWRRKAEGTGWEWDSRISVIIWRQKQSYWNLYSIMWFLAFFKIIWGRLESRVVSFLTYRQIRSISLFWNDHYVYILNLIFPTASSVQSLEASESRGVEMRFNSQVFSSIICPSIRGN